MSQIMKAFTGIFMVLFITATSMGVLGAFLQVTKAQNYHAMIIDEIENSDYYVGVCEECYKLAKESNYRLTITFYHENGGYVSCTKSEELPENLSEFTMAKVVLGFDIQIPFLGVKCSQEILGYAR